MSRIAFVNGRYLPITEAGVNVEDRGLTFSDAVYEVILVRRGNLVDEDLHLDRLEYSAGEIRLTLAVGRRPLKLVMREVLRRNIVDNGIIFLQMTRGVRRGPRDASFPSGARTTLIITAHRLKLPDRQHIAKGVAVVTAPDLRWRRCDIKSTSVLANVLAKQHGVDAGAFDTWQFDDQGFVTEGSASNAFIIVRDGTLITRPLSPAILKGITRTTLLRLAGELGVPVAERAFTVGEAKQAREAFLSSASSLVLPVTRIDEATIGNGMAGPTTMALFDRYGAYAEGEGGSGTLASSRQSADI